MGALGKYVRNELGAAGDVIQNMGDAFTSITSSIFGYAGALFEVAKNGETFVGLQYSQIEPIRTSIRTYVDNIQKVLDGLNEKASISGALKGDAANATKEYVNAVSQVANAYVSALLAYSDKMYEYGEEYKKNDTQLQSDITDEAKALSSSAEVYTEKY